VFCDLKINKGMVIIMDINQIQDEEEMIAVGDKVDLVAQMDKVYRTMIEDKIENGLFLAGVPSRQGSIMQVEQDDDLYLVFYRETGRYIAQMKVIALEKRGEIRYMWLAQKTPAQKNQRREAFRLPVSCDVEIFTYIEDTEKNLTSMEEVVKTIAFESVSSRDISVTGIALLTKKEYDPEEKYTLNLYLERENETTKINAENTPPERVTATVKRCIPWRTSNKYDTGMQFFGLTKDMSESLARFVLTEQQKQMKKRRLL